MDLTANQIEEWRTKIKNKIWSEFCAEPNEAHGTKLMKDFDALCDLALAQLEVIAAKAHKRAFDCWRSMLYRCDNQSAPNFKHYGGRGIKVCARWREFANFLADMGDPPQGKSIDRYPNRDGDYEPGNCRWATPSEQIVNQERTHLVELRGKLVPLRYAAKELGIDERTVYGRIRRGWSEHDALHTPVER